MNLEGHYPARPEGRLARACLLYLVDPDESGPLVQRYAESIADDAAARRHLWSIAERLGIVQLVAHTLRELAWEELIPDVVRERWAAGRDRSSALFSVARCASAELTARGVEHAFIEGSGTWARNQLPEAAYTSGDVDLLVEAGALPETRSVVERLGFAAADRRQRPTRRREFVSQPASGPALWFEVGEWAFDRMWKPLDFLDPSQVLLPGASRFEGGLPSLPAPAALLMDTIHLSTHGFVRSPALRIMLDVYSGLRAEAASASRLAAMANSILAGRRSLLAVAVTTRVLGAPAGVDLPGNLGPWMGRAFQTTGLSSMGSPFDSGCLPTMARMDTLRLDVSLDERGRLHWLIDTIWPDRQWIGEHEPRGARPSLISARVRRLARALRGWNPV